MCGRFTLTTNDYDGVAGAFGAALDSRYAPRFRARYNIAPSDEHWIVCSVEGRRRILPALWGMPGPARETGDAGSGHINARAETVHQRPTFREAFRRGRCGVLADGFFEWTGSRSDRQPVWFHTHDGSPMLFAGLFCDRVDPGTGEVVRRFTIVTTDANALVAPFHHRMPVVLARRDYDRWLQLPSSEELDARELDGLRRLLGPAPEDLLVATVVSKRVNTPRFDDPRCIEPRSRPQQQQLF